MKPKLTLSVLKPVRVIAKNVRWHEIEGCRDLGKKNVFFTYLKIKNIGRADAEDCTCAYVQSQEVEKETKEYLLPVESPLVYSGLIPFEVEIVVGTYQFTEISLSGRNVLGVTSKTIPKRGCEATLLLAFTIQGTTRMLLGTTEGATYPLEPRTVLLRTSVDGKLHTVRLKPTASGPVEAELL